MRNLKTEIKTVKTYIYRFLCHYKRLNVSSARVININSNSSKIIEASHSVYCFDVDNETFFFKKLGLNANDCKIRAEISKKFAYESMADLLGLSEMVLHSELCIAQIDCEEQVVGILQKKSLGIDIWDISSSIRTQMIKPCFQRRVNLLQYLDFICNELDHSLNNYYPIVGEDGRFENVSAFDNGGAGSFGLSGKIAKGTYYGCSSLINEYGNLNFPFIDKELFEKLESVTLYSVFRYLNKYMGIIPIIQTWRRLRKVYVASCRCLKFNDGILLRQIEWNESSINEELTGKYGNTYLYSLVNDWKDK